MTNPELHSYATKDESEPRKFYLYPETIDATRLTLRGVEVPRQDGAIAGNTMFCPVSDTASIPTLPKYLAENWQGSLKWIDMAPHAETGVLEEKYAFFQEVYVCTARNKFGWSATLAVRKSSSPTPLVLATVECAKSQIDAAQAVVNAAVLCGTLQLVKEEL